MFEKSWIVLCQLAPWLLVGMLLSGVMHVVLPENYIRRKFVGFWGVVKAVLFGVPLPLCSCGVIPAGIGLKNQGASDGAAVGFLISTPQTGVDSILVSATFFGWPFALFKMFAAAVTGIIGGLFADQANGTTTERVEAPEETQSSVSLGNPLLRVWSHGIEIVRSIWLWLLIGVVLSAAIELLVPDAWFAQIGSWGLLPAMLLALVVSAPLYVCATASVPIAAALVTSGLPPAAALVFLMAGPATNITTMGAIHSRFGWRTLGVYLGTLIFGSMAFGWLFSQILAANVVEHISHAHDHTGWLAVGSAVVLLLMIGSFIMDDINRGLRRRMQRARMNHDADGGATSTTIGVSGMNCQSCVAKLESAIGKVEGVDFVDVDLAQETATIAGQYDELGVREAVESAGFRTK